MSTFQPGEIVDITITGARIERVTAEGFNDDAIEVMRVVAYNTSGAPCVMPTRYGAAFDRLADRWRALEFEHDQYHPDRDQCGGVGGCSLMAAAHDLERQMSEELDCWRTKTARSAGRSS